MSLEQLNAFMAKVSEDKELQAKLEALAKSDLEAAINAGLAMAAEFGYEVTADDWHEFNVANEERPLTDDELDAVAGGGNCTGKAYL